MEQTHIEQFKKRLTEEKERLEKELATVGRPNPAYPGDWEAIPDEADSAVADKNDRADAMEDLEENTSIVNELELRLKDVNDALARVAAGTYGKDEVTGEEIPLARLEANPSARTAGVK